MTADSFSEGDMMGFYNNMIKYLAGFFCRLYRVEVIGAENIPADTEDTGAPAFLLCSNHIGNMDPVVIGAAIRIKIYWMAKDSLFRIPLLKQLISAFGAYPVSRGSGDVGAIKKTVEQLQHHRSVGIFPQGHRFPGIPPEQTQIRHGAGMMLYRSGADALPVCIETKSRKLRPFCKTRVIIGRRIPNEALGLSEGNAQTYREATEKIFAQICALSEAHRTW
ncbi:MAG: 1-acyl-sn-glycerol-3-phosphate acyltransferase [Clostridia bacterium]|nr:1-acyl-sn-glycerol-3-phosphate acyltransferase [Clostridia bacterium]